MFGGRTRAGGFELELVKRFFIRRGEKKDGSDGMGDGPSCMLIYMANWEGGGGGGGEHSGRIGTDVRGGGRPPQKSFGNSNERGIDGFLVTDSFYQRHNKIHSLL